MLSIESLAFSYGGRSILRDLSFSIQEGEILHVTGPNGAGKTTLMRILAGLLKEQGGHIQWAPPPIADDARSLWEYLPSEANALFHKVSAYDNLAFWYALRHGSPDRARLEAELAFWDLRGILLQRRMPVGKFSTGMKRRLALARLRLAGARLWLLDEPLYGLDSKGLARFHDSLAAHTQNGGSAIIVSHDPSPLAALPVRILELGTLAPPVKEGKA